MYVGCWLKVNQDNSNQSRPKSGLSSQKEGHELRVMKHACFH